MTTTTIDLVSDDEGNLNDEDSDAISNTLKSAQKTMTTYTVKFAVTGTDHDGYYFGECADDVNLKNNPWTPPSSWNSTRRIRRLGAHAHIRRK